MAQVAGSFDRHKVTPIATFSLWRSEWIARWRDATPRTRCAIQMTVFILVVVGAYNYSLITLVQNLSLETPLAYVSLVPAIALALAAVRARPRRFEPAIYDRQVDYIIGIPLLGAALVINVALPKQLSVMFWVWRIDLLSMPLFVAGVTAIIFGVRVLWRQRLAVAYLLLAWPVPYTAVLLSVLNGFTDLTLSAVHGVLRVVHVASPLPSVDGSLFKIVHGGSSFPISIVSACSGVNGVVGFLLVGSAFGAVVRGPIIRKTLWLAGGMVLLWFMNLFRLVFILWAGHVWGEDVAINILHPFAGVVTFSIGIVLMLCVLRPLGLHILNNPMPNAAPMEGSPQPRSTRALAVPKVHAAFIVVIVAGIVLGLTNFNLRAYNLVANSAGETRLVSFTIHPVAPTGWRAVYFTQYDWAKPYFGEDSTWVRYEFYSPSSGELQSSFPVTADVINTTDLSTFSAYGIEACYQFHGYTLANVSDVDLGGGITGQSLSYSTPGNTSWSIVYWIVPVKNGQSTHYERVVLYLLDSLGAVVHVPNTVNGITNLAGTLNSLNPADRVLLRNRAFLVAFARQLILVQAHEGQPLAAAVEKPRTRQAT